MFLDMEWNDAYRSLHTTDAEEFEDLDIDIGTEDFKNGEIPLTFLIDPRVLPVLNYWALPRLDVTCRVTFKKTCPCPIILSHEEQSLQHLR